MMETYYGIVRENRVELDSGSWLPDGARVEIRLQGQAQVSPDDARRAGALRDDEDVFKDGLRAAGRLAMARVDDAATPPDRRPVQVSGELLSEQIVRERR